MARSKARSLAPRVNVANKAGAYRFLIQGYGPDTAALRRVVTAHTVLVQHGQPTIYQAAPQRARLALMALADVSDSIEFGLTLDAKSQALVDELEIETNELNQLMRAPRSRVRAVLPPRFRRKLTKNQRKNLEQLLAMPHGADFSVPGAGKTAVTLALHEVLRHKRVVGPMLVVCPRNAFRPWEDEVEKCFRAPRPQIVRLTGGRSRVHRLLRVNPTADVFLISYNQASVVTEELEAWLSGGRAVHLVLDESHRIKRGATGMWASALHQLAPLAARRDILSGTPLPNGPIDLGSQLQFLWPLQSVVAESELASPDLRALSRRLRPFYVRTTKKELGLPKQTPIRTDVEMGSIQGRIYEAVRSAAAAALSGASAADQAEFADLRRSVVRLMQVATNPALVRHHADEFEVPPLRSTNKKLSQLFSEYARYEVPPKFLLVRQRVAERVKAGKKTIVWSSFVQNLRMLESLLAEFGSVRVFGGTPVSADSGEIEDGSREALIEQFKLDDATRVLIANPAACGESISLHMVCDYSIYLDRSFNAAHLLQSMERTHRLGLPRKRETFYEFLTSPNTIDEVIQHRLSLKLRALGRVLDDAGLEQLSLDVDASLPDVEFDPLDADEALEHIMRPKK